MAAKTKICRCLSSIFNECVFILILCLCSGIHHVHAQTTQTTTPVATTTTPQVTTIEATTTTTQAPTTTTTLPPTTTIAPNEPRTSIGETIIGQCLCDLTGNECDINCCCDPDCSDEDKTAFVCDTRSVTIDDKMCYQKNVFIFSNSPATTETTNEGLFCIYYDNYKERNFYLDPDFIQDFPTFAAYLDKYSDPSLQQPVSYPEPTYGLDSTYRAGDPIFVVYPDESVGNMVLPTTLGSNVCNDQNAIGYLTEATTQCTRDVTLTALTCTGTPGIDAASYFRDFRVVRTPGLFGYVVNGTFVGITTPAPPITAAPPVTTAGTGGTTGTGGTGTTTTVTTTTTTTTPAPSTVDPSRVQNLYDNEYTVAVDATSLQHLCKQANGSLVPCSFTNPPSPSFTPGTPGTCGNVVLEARYVITTNGSFGIGAVQVQFVFGDAVQSDFPLAQGYSVTFNSAFDSAEAVARSGNPGYQLDKYLLYGELNQTSSAEGTVQTIVTSPDPTLGLTVVRASATGECDPATSSRVPVRFGQNMRTGCLIRCYWIVADTLIYGTPKANRVDPDETAPTGAVSSGSTLFANTSNHVTMRLAATTTEAECEQLQRTIVETLEGPNTPEYDPAATTDNRWIDNNRYVATFGNVPNYKVGDWVRIIIDGRTMPPQTGTDKCRLRTGLHIQILYANVGALANPQAKIVGVALIYDNARDVDIRCTGAFCQSANAGQTQAFEVTQTVSFVDVSQPAVKYQGEAPIFIAKVPNDFFYPFLYYTNAATRTGSTFAQVTVAMTTSLFVMLCLDGKKFAWL